MKKTCLFKAADKDTLLKVMLNVTMPSVAICAFSSLERDLSVLFIVALGLFASGFPWIIGTLMTRKQDAFKRALYMCNCPTYNIGCCILPFVQSFLQPASIVGVCLFDIGNGIIIHGMTYNLSAFALHLLDDQKSFMAILKKIFSSVPFCVYTGMLVLFLIGIKLPTPVYTVLGNIAQANGFLAMFIIGLMLEFSGSLIKLKDVFGILTIRLSCSTMFACLMYYYTPYSLPIRQGLVFAVFAPICALSAPYTQHCGADGALSGLATSISILISITIAVVILIL